MGTAVSAPLAAARDAQEMVTWRRNAGKQTETPNTVCSGDPTELNWGKKLRHDHPIVTSPPPPT